MQLHGGSCDAWSRLLAGETTTLSRSTKAVSRKATTTAATARRKPQKPAALCRLQGAHVFGRRYFSDCCTRGIGD